MTKKYLQDEEKRIQKGGAKKYHDANRVKGKLFVRDRLAYLLDDMDWLEDGFYANASAKDLPADGVITGMGTIQGRRVCFIANDSTIKAGSWGKRTVEKIIRIQETALKLKVPIFYLVDSAGARITDQLEMYPGRRGAGRIFYNQVHLSGVVPQICLLFGPSAAGGAYIPAFCDVVIMVEGNASMYLGSPRIAEMVIGEKSTLEEMGGAKMHCSVSGCGDVLCKTEEEAIETARLYISYFPQNHKEKTEDIEEKDALQSFSNFENTIPKNPLVAFNMMECIERIVDEDSLFEMKKLFAGELITAFARIKGKVVGIIANQPKVKGGILFHDSADKGARFISICNSFSIPLLFLVDVPGFMVGKTVERAGIIRHGAKMIFEMSKASVPKITVVVRKAYGAGLYAMAGPAFDTDCVLALPTAEIAVMGADAAINAVYANVIAQLDDSEREEFLREKKEEYEKDISIYHLASELIVDHIVNPTFLRDELSKRMMYYENNNANGMGVFGIAPV